MLLIAASQAQRIDGVALPEASIWDGYHAVMAALSRHRRDEAQAALQRLAAEHAEHRLTLSAQRALAAYDNDPLSELAITERLLAACPDDVNLRLAKASLLALVGSRGQQAAWWEAMVDGPRADPVVLTRYADFLSDDGREHRKARKLYEQALDRMPTHAAAWAGLAGTTWQRGKRPLARELSYFAACLAEMNEGLADTHFRSCRFMGHAADGLAFLRARVQRLGVGVVGAGDDAVRAARCAGARHRGLRGARPGDREARRTTAACCCSPPMPTCATAATPRRWTC